jgi:alkanesulfonate monooxygenase SsuD/methylene tetrahydromethanopterin reductase-like flavin-dependent oxidoreductase (luciferase family)
MRYGISVPNFADYGDVRLLAELAYEAEEAGWDGFFLWDHMVFDTGWHPANVDPWVAMTAIALRTSRIRFGPMVTPVARRRPWKLARETVTLDQLSGGRLIFGVGLGDPADVDYGLFGEDTDARIRAKKLDEGLDVLAGLWSGQPFSYSGTHFQIQETVFLPPPVQSPRIPIWAAGWWPNKPPMRRAARWDGVFPLKLTGDGRPAMLTPDDLRQIIAYITEHRTSAGPFDVVIAGDTPAGDTAHVRDVLAPYAEAGVTWWLESLDSIAGSLEPLRARIRQGPPQV